jgi:predicted acylesterase/phospholipase RssA
MREGPTVVPGLAVCLGSSFLGHYAHAGFLNRLWAGGVVPERLAGSSAGAIAGGLFAAGIRGAELERLVLSVWFKRAFADFGFPLRLPGVLSGLYGTGLLSGGRMRRFLTKRIGARPIEDLRAPALELAVTNLSDGRAEIVRCGPLIEFMVASFAMPVVFTPQRIDGKVYCDGGVANETPFGHWLGDPGVATIVVHTIRHPAPGRPPRSVPAVLAQAHRAVGNETFARLRERAADSGKRVLVLETAHDHPGLLQGRRARAFLAAGAGTAGPLGAELLRGGC